MVSVYIEAPRAFCLQRTMDRMGVTADVANATITQTDKYRADYYEYHTGCKWTDAMNYDLCLDSSKLGFEKCVEAIKAYAKVRFGEI